MDFLLPDPTVPQEDDPLTVMLEFSGFINSQARRIRAGYFDSNNDMGIATIEQQGITDLVTDFSRMPA